MSNYIIRESLCDMNLYVRFMTWLGADPLSTNDDLRFSRRDFLRETWGIFRWVLILPILWLIWYILEALYEGRTVIIAMSQFALVIFTLCAAVLLFKLILVWAYNHLSPPAKVIIRGIGDTVNAVLLMVTGVMLWHLYEIQDFGTLLVSLLFVGGMLIQIFRESVKKNQKVQ